MKVLNIRTDEVPAQDLYSLNYFPHTKPRPPQVKLLHLLEKYVDHFDNIFLQAPPGIGKTAIADAFSKFFISRKEGSKAIVLVGRKQLLTQYRDGYKYQVLMGQNEYPCIATPTLIDPDGMGQGVRVDAAPCKYLKKRQFKCPYDPRNKESNEDVKCPYWDLRERIAKMPLAAVSTLSALNIPALHGRDLLVWDEADNAFQDLVSYFTVNLHEEYYAKRYRFKFTRGIDKDRRPLVGKKDYWDTVIPHLISEVEHEMDAVLEEQRKHIAGGNINERYLMNVEFRVHNLTKRLSKLVEIRDMLMNLRRNFVISHNYDPDKPVDYMNLEFKPVSVASAVSDILTSIGGTRVFMGATLNPPLLARQLGVDPQRSLVINYVKHPYPVDNRLVNLVPVGSMSYRNRNDTLPILVSVINGILSHHKGQAGLILPNSKWLEVEIANGIVDDSRILRHKSTSFSLNNAIKRWEGSRDKVIISTYISMGFDGSHGDFIMIPKVGYASLGDPWVQARLAIRGFGEREYQWNAIKDAIQKSLRSTRSETDKSVIYLLDSDYLALLKRNREDWLEWYLESIRVMSPSDFMPKEVEPHRPSAFSSRPSLS